MDRFNPAEVGWNDPMVAATDGDYVLHSDHEAEVSALRDQLHQANEDIKALQQQLAIEKDRVQTVKWVRYASCPGGCFVMQPSTPWWPLEKALVYPSLEAAMDAVVIVLKDKGVLK